MGRRWFPEAPTPSFPLRGQGSERVQRVAASAKAGTPPRNDPGSLGPSVLLGETSSKGRRGQSEDLQNERISWKRTNFFFFIFGLFSNCLRVKAEGGGMGIEQSDDYDGSSSSGRALPDFRDPYRETV